MSGVQSQGVAVPAAQQLRFSGGQQRKAPPTPAALLAAQAAAGTTTASRRRDAQWLLKDYYLKPSSKAAWEPSLATAFRILILARFFSAMYSGLDDCDEVFNYWEPLHYLLKNVGFQTWEYSPVYAIRSYFYLVVNSLPGLAFNRFHDKRAAFFALRLAFASVSSFFEALLVRSTAIHVSPHVAKYTLFALLVSPGMWAASTAFLPSSFAMHAVTLMTAAALTPVERTQARRVSFALTALAVGAFVGWPFVAALALPAVLEQLFLVGPHALSPNQGALRAAKRAQALAVASTLAAAVLAYEKKWTVVPWNIVSYNLFSSRTSPTLYGVEPPSYYLKSLLLAYNLFAPLALLSLPALLVSVRVDAKRFGDVRDRPRGSTHPALSVAVRLSGLYVWLALLLTQSHKEERFLYPVYPLVALNGSVTLYLLRGWAQVFYLKRTNSPWRTSTTAIFSHLTRSVVFVFVFFALFRLRALHAYYHAPLRVYHHLQALELPRLALELHPDHYGALHLTAENVSSKALAELETRFDLSPLRDDGVRLCVGKEWHRFPGHYLVPDEVDVQWIRSDFDGLMPKKWKPGGGLGGKRKGLWGMRRTSEVPTGMNDENRFEDDGRFVDISTCTYLVDLDFPLRSSSSSSSTSSRHEPRYAVDSANWDRAFCAPFLDNARSHVVTRVLAVPGLDRLGLEGWRNEFGDYCLLRNKRWRSPSVVASSP